MLVVISLKMCSDKSRSSENSFYKSTSLRETLVQIKNQCYEQ